jgi:hypothetical protein
VGGVLKGSRDITRAEQSAKINPPQEHPWEDKKYFTCTTQGGYWVFFFFLMLFHLVFSKAGTLPLEPHLHSIFLWLFWR